MPLSGFYKQQNRAMLIKCTKSSKAKTLPYYRYNNKHITILYKYIVNILINGNQLDASAHTPWFAMETRLTTLQCADKKGK